MRKRFLLLAAGLSLAGAVAADPAAVPAPAAAPESSAGLPAPKADASAAPADKPDTVLFPRTPEPVLPARSAASGLGGTTMTLFVLLAGAAAGWLFWRRLRGVRDTGRGQQLAIAETRSLGNRQFLVVAAYGERKFLLGVCPGRIDLLSPLDAPKPPAP